MRRHVALEVTPVKFAGKKLQAKLEVSVIFSGTSQRRIARLVKWATEGENDLALLKIETFKGIPHVDDLKLDIGRPELGSDILILGYPLGRAAIMGKTIDASVFKSVVSRNRGSYIQVDGAVHPGGSGGPAIDARGRVFGVVVAIQAVPTRGMSRMGYVLPIDFAKTLWPPD